MKRVTTLNEEHIELPGNRECVVATSEDALYIGVGWASDAARWLTRHDVVVLPIGVLPEIRRALEESA